MPGQLGVRQRRLVDVAVGLDDGLAQQRRRPGAARPAGASAGRASNWPALRTSDDLALEDLDRHAAGALTAEVAAHAVRHRVQRDVVVAQEAVLVVVALATDVGRAPADDSHLRTGYLTPDGGGVVAGGLAAGGAAAGGLAAGGAAAGVRPAAARRRGCGGRRARRRPAPQVRPAARAQAIQPRARRAWPADASIMKSTRDGPAPAPTGIRRAAVDALADEEVAHDVGALLCLGLRDALGVHLDPDLRDLRDAPS